MPLHRCWDASTRNLSGPRQPHRGEDFVLQYLITPLDLREVAQAIEGAAERIDRESSLVWDDVDLNFVEFQELSG